MKIMLAITWLSWSLLAKAFTNTSGNSIYSLVSSVVPLPGFNILKYKSENQHRIKNP